MSGDDEKGSDFSRQVSFGKAAVVAAAVIAVAAAVVAAVVAGAMAGTMASPFGSRACHHQHTPSRPVRTKASRRAPLTGRSTPAGSFPTTLDDHRDTRQSPSHRVTESLTESPTGNITQLHTESPSAEFAEILAKQRYHLETHSAIVASRRVVLSLSHQALYRLRRETLC